MTEAEKDVLDKIYSQLYSSALTLDAELNSGGFECDWGWYNYGLNDTDDDVCPFPVPVFKVYGAGGIALLPEGSVFDARLSKKDLMSLDMRSVFGGRRVEIYDTESGDTLVCGKDDGVDSFITRVFLTPSDSFRVRVYFPGAVSFNDFRTLLAAFAVKEDENEE